MNERIWSSHATNIERKNNLLDVFEELLDSAIGDKCKIMGCTLSVTVRGNDGLAGSYCSTWGSVSVSDLIRLIVDVANTGEPIYLE